MSLFLTFEGGEGAGKSTQARALHQRLSGKGIPALLTYEPGGTPLGREVRRWLKGERNNETGNVDPLAELLLFNASRAELVSNVIQPALKSGITVICDRFYHSTVAYQGHGRGLSMDLIEAVNNIATGRLKPDLTVFLDLTTEHGLSRKKPGDRFEREAPDFHNRVRRGYLMIVKEDPGRWLVIDGSLPKKEIESIILERVGQLLPKAVEKVEKK